MNKKIQDLKKQYQQLEKDLSDPKIVANQELLKQASREFSRLEPIVKKIQELEQVEKKLTEAQNTLIAETDDDLIVIAQEEANSLAELRKTLAKEVEQNLKPPDPLDQKNIIMEIRAGPGGDEAALFAAELFRMYSRYAENQSWRPKILSANRTEIGGFKEIIFEVSGNNVFKNLKYESGVHRVQRVPNTEKSGRVHTSAATVAVLPAAEEIDIAIKPEDLRIDVFRSGGHGGQSVNTTDSAVRITHLPTNLVVTCQDEKSQQQNKAKAMQILRSRLYAAEQERLTKERRETRKSQIGSGDRSEKIRTYNFPQDRVTDHRLKQNFGQIEKIMAGDINQIIAKLQEADK